MKILYLIIASNDPIHIQDEITQRKTWANESQSEVIWLRGGTDEYFNQESRTLYVKIDEDYKNILSKTILGVKWCIKNVDFDILIRGNVSTYFATSKIRRHFKKIKIKDDLLGGHIDFVSDESKSLDDSVFINGGAIFLTRKAAITLTNLDVQEWDSWPDDFAISRYLITHGVALSQIPRCSLSATGFFSNRIYYRLKSSSNSKMASMRMLSIHKYFEEPRILHKCYQLMLLEINEIKYFKQNFINLQEYCRSIYSVLSIRRLRFLSRIGLRDGF